MANKRFIPKTSVVLFLLAVFTVVALTAYNPQPDPIEAQLVKHRPDSANLHSLIGYWILPNAEKTQKTLPLETLYEYEYEIEEAVREPFAVPIFMYHTSSEHNPGGIPELYVRPSVFERQMLHLIENGFTFVTFDDWDNLHNIERPVFITFDDGYRANYTEIFPILKRHNIRITIFLTLVNVRPGYLTPDMIRRMSDSGLVKFESHTLSHRNLASISSDEQKLIRELRDSRYRIEELTGKPVVAIAYPYGRFNDRVLEVVPEFYRFGISTLPGKHIVGEHCDFAIRRLRVSRSTSLNAFINMLG